MGEGSPSVTPLHAPDPDCAECTRLRAALLAELATSDYDSISEDRLAAAAGTSLSGHYEDLDTCLGAAYGEVDAVLGKAFETAMDGSGPWTERLADAVVQTSARLERMPGALHVYEAARSGPEWLRVFQASKRGRYVELLANHAPDVPEVHLEFLIGALYTAAQEQTQSPKFDVPLMRRRAREIIAALEPAAL
jgi:hypothetical protein